MYVYDDGFFAQADETAAASAKGLIRHLAAELPVRSVLDVGCGRGVWLAQWLRSGATDIVGVDGPYVDVERLAISRSAFLARDVTEPFSLKRKFDLVQSLEVAEHLDPSRADTFIDNLVRHGPVILFSAAIPGQGGENHLNEQSWEYWRVKFASRQYELFDFVRPRVRDDSSIYFCYRYNSFVYAHQSVVASLPKAIRASHVPAAVPLHNELTPWLRFRFAAVRCLPRGVVDNIARVKYRARNIAIRWR
jgi:SAM-dependent methyltransferase